MSRSEGMRGMGGGGTYGIRVVAHPSNRFPFAEFCDKVFVQNLHHIAVHILAVALTVTGTNPSTATAGRMRSGAITGRQTRRAQRATTSADAVASDVECERIGDRKRLGSGARTGAATRAAGAAPIALCRVGVGVVAIGVASASGGLEFDARVTRAFAGSAQQ